MSQQNPFRVTVNESLQLFANFEALPGDLKWGLEAGGGKIRSSAALGADGTVFFGSGDNKVHAVDGATGLQKWEFATGDDIEASPAVGADGKVYVGSLDRKVYALNGITGRKYGNLRRAAKSTPPPPLAPMARSMLGRRMVRFTPWTGQPARKSGSSRPGETCFLRPP